MKFSSSGWQQLSRRFDERPKRERWLIAATLLAAIVLLADSVVLSPLHEGWMQVRQEERTLSTQVHALTLQEQQLKTAARQPNEALEQARQKVQPLVEQVGQLQSTLLSSSRMQDFLSGLLPGGSALRIVAMRTLPVEDIALSASEPATSAPAPSEAPQGVYRHGIELQVEGAYLELLGYVRRIEQAPWKLVIEGMSIETQQYPQAVLTLRLSTFSLEPQWLRLGS